MMADTFSAANDSNDSCWSSPDGTNNNSVKDTTSKKAAGFSSSFLIDSIIGAAATKLESTSSPNFGAIDCRLESIDLWQRFHDLGTEMIITKSGRRMFPTIRISFSLGNGASVTQLDPHAKYVVAVDIVPIDNKRYRYAYHKSSWLVAGKGNHVSSYRYYVHPDSPFTEHQLLTQTISFEKLKVTNNQTDRNGYIVLNSMHKYQPRIYLFQENDYSIFQNYVSKMSLMNAAGRCEASVRFPEIKPFVFDELQFIAVTAYQNQLITRLKIDSNPFAKGFRDSGRLVDLERERLEQAFATSQILKAAPWPIGSRQRDMLTNAVPDMRSCKSDCERESAADVDCMKLNAEQKPNADSMSVSMPLQMPLPLSMPMPMPMQLPMQLSMSSPKQPDVALQEQLSQLSRGWFAEAQAGGIVNDTWQMFLSNLIQLAAARQLYNLCLPFPEEQLRQLQAALPGAFAEQNSLDLQTSAQNASSKSVAGDSDSMLE